MSQASILHTHDAASHFATPARTSDPRKLAVSPAQDNSRNYLPGLRPVANELQAYFKDEFVWLNC